MDCNLYFNFNFYINCNGTVLKDSQKTAKGSAEGRKGGGKSGFGGEKRRMAACCGNKTGRDSHALKV